MENESGKKISISTQTEDTDTRIDLYLAFNFKEFTRSRIQALIKGGNVKVNSNSVKASYRLKAGDEIDLTIPPSLPYELNPEPLDLQIIYEDPSIIFTTISAVSTEGYPEKES